MRGLRGMFLAMLLVQTAVAAALREQGLIALGAAFARMARGLIATWPGRNDQRQ